MLEQYASIVSSASARYGVPASWINAVIMTESSGQQYAYRDEPQIHDGSYGLMQLLERTARGLGFNGDTDELFDPVVNIDLGTRLLSDLRSRYVTFERVYSAYNSGSPDRYQTSTQVAANVQRATSWLEKFGGTVAIGGGAVLILLLVVLWYFNYRKR